MFIVGLGTASPSHCYTQKESWETLQGSEQFPKLRTRSQSILRKVLLGENGIATRHLCLSPLSEAFQLHPDALHGRFEVNAPLLATQAAQRALESSAFQAEAIDAVIISTCTGYLCPGLTSYVGERLGLRADVLALDLVGQGCGAALPNLRAAESLLASGRCQRVLSVCVEICSAAFYLDDDPGVLVSACLFGDGAGAVISSNEPKKNRRHVRWVASESAHSPNDRDCLRFDQKNGMLRNILSLRVPEVAGKHVAALFERSLQRAGVTRQQITTWILHAGGREILHELKRVLQLEESDLRWSAQILRDFGNVSSPCVFFVLEAALSKHARAGYWWMSAFGAGFSSHAALLKVE